MLQTQSPAQNVGAKFPPISSISGCGLFCNGVNNLPATEPPSSSSSEASTIATLGGLTPNSYTATGMQQLLSFANRLLLVQRGNNALQNGANYAKTLTGLLPSNRIQTAFPGNNPLASQLLTVANHRSEPIRRHSGAVVRCQSGQCGDGLPEYRQLSVEQPGLPRLEPPQPSAGDCATVKTD